MAREISAAMREEAVRLVVADGLGVRQVCELLGVGPTAVRRWVEQWRHDNEPVAGTAGPGPGPGQERQRIAELEAKVARLQEERDLLKKSIAFFVRESDRQKR